MSTSEREEDLLKEIRERYDQAEAEWQGIRAQGDVDMRFVAGDPWDPEDRRAREAASRPCVGMDEIGQYLNQVINTTRSNPRAMKFAPTGNGANDDGAEFYADKAREVEYRSHAQLAYTTAFQNCVERSYGWVRLTTKYENNRSLNQDIWIEDIPNPNMVLPDPLSKRPDSSDLRYLFFRETLPVAEFSRRWPEAKLTEFGPESWALAPSWFSDDRTAITVAEYWVKELKRKRRLLLLKLTAGGAPVEVFRDDLKEEPAKDRILRERTVEEFNVTQYLTNGVEILETNPWKGQYIPFASCFGKVIYLDGKRQILSMTRLARDPAMMHAYMATCEAEIVGAVPRNAWIGYAGQFRNPDEWQKAAHEPVVFLEAEAMTDQTGQQILPLPQRQPWDPPLQNIEIAKEAARRSIQAAIMGSPLPTSAQRHNEKSGVALQQIEKSGQIGSFHFTDHYNDMIRHVGVMFEDLLDKILDAARDTGIRDAKGDAKIVRINDPKPDPQQFSDPQAFQVALKAWQARLPDGSEDTYDTKGDYLVTVSAGPAADSQREAVADFIGNLMQVPAVQQMAPDLVVRLQGSTMGFGQLNPLLDELAERITPPQFKKPKEGEGPDPQQMQAEMQKAGELIEQLKGMVGKLTQEITTKQVEAASKEKIAQYEMQCKKELADIDADKDLALQVMKNAATIAVAHIAAAAKGAQIAAHADEEAQALGLEAESQAHTQAHERGMLEQEHAHELEAAEQAHAHNLEAAEHGVAGQIIAAENQPQPETGA